MTARFITAPDKLPKTDLENNQSKILMVDVEWHDVEAIAILCMTKQVKYDFYLFGPTSMDEEWLDHAIETADVILINNNEESDRHIDIKSKLNKSEKALSMGSSLDELTVPIDYIVKQLEVE